MKKFIVILMVISLMVFLSGSIFAQSTSGIDAKLVNQAGHQLESYAFQYYTGFWLQVGGAIIAALSFYSSPALASLGLLVALIGEFMQFFAAGNIGSAGASLVAASSGQ